MISEQFIYAFGWVSWGSIIAGSVTAIALSIIMATLGVALGFTVVDPKSDDPASGLGVAFGIWSFISIAVSLAGGGFIAGLFSGQRGIEHGFLVWAVVAIVATCFSSVAVGTALKSIGSVVRHIGSAAAEVAGTLGKGAAHAASAAISELQDKVDINLDTEKINENISSVLRDTGIDTLQPDYLQQQMREARSDLRTSLHKLSLEPHNADQIISQFLDTEKKRLDSFTKDINKEDAVQAVMKARNIPQEEAQKMVDNAISGYNHAVQKAKDSLAEAKSQVSDAKQYLKEMAEQAKVKADRLAGVAAKAALAAGIAMIVAAIISMGAGACGASYATDWYSLQTASFIVK